MRVCQGSGTFITKNVIKRFIKKNKDQWLADIWIQ